MERVSLSEIENVNRGNLNEDRLKTLQSGYSSFENVLNSSSDPIALYKGTKPYQIADGRHRIFLARQKGYSHINAKFV